MSDKPRRPPPVPPAEVAALAARLSELVEAAAISPAELARRAGLTDGAVRHYLAGRTAPTLGTLLPLAKALGVKPAEFIKSWPVEAVEPEPKKPAARKKSGGSN